MGAGGAYGLVSLPLCAGGSVSLLDADKAAAPVWAQMWQRMVALFHFQTV